MERKRGKYSPVGGGMVAVVVWCVSRVAETVWWKLAFVREPSRRFVRSFHILSYFVRNNGNDRSHRDTSTSSKGV